MQGANCCALHWETLWTLWHHCVSSESGRQTESSYLSDITVTSGHLIICVPCTATRHVRVYSLVVKIGCCLLLGSHSYHRQLVTWCATYRLVAHRLVLRVLSLLLRRCTLDLLLLSGNLWLWVLRICCLHWRSSGWLIIRCKGLGRRLNDRATACHSLDLFDLKIDTRLLSSLFAESLVLLVHVHNKFLHMITGQGVLVKVSRTDAQMKRFIAFFLARTLLEAGALTTKA